MKQSLFRWGFFLSLLFSTLLLWGCSAPTQPAQTPVVVTVVNAVPVEVTRMVSVQQTVEVTREVVITQLVQVPVTTTPAASTATPTPPSPTPMLSTAAPTIVWIPTRPPIKVNGISYFKITNNTDSKADVVFNGPVIRNFVVGARSSLPTSLPWGSYTYQILQDGRIAFNGEIRLVNSDKYEMVINEDHISILTP